MIFPDIRISQLEADVIKKENAFLQSREVFNQTLHQKTKPLTLLTENSGFIFGTLFTFLSSSKILLKVAPLLFSRNKSGFFWKVLKAGWVIKIIQMGSSFMTNKKKTKIQDLITHFLTSFISNLRKKITKS